MSYRDGDESITPPAVTPEETSFGIKETELMRGSEIFHIAVRSVKMIADVPVLKVKKSVQVSGDFCVDLPIDVELILQTVIPVPFIIRNDIPRVLHPYQPSEVIAVVPVQGAAQGPFGDTAGLYK